MDSNAPSIQVSSKLAYLKPGMYLVRLVDGGLGSVLMLSATPVGRGSLDFFPGDGVLRNALSKVGDCIVVRVNNALGSLLLTEFHKPGQQQRVTVKIDQVTQENLASALSSQGDTSADASLSSAHTPAVRLLGHIEKKGDIVSRDGWLGDPSSDLRIEGFEVTLSGFTERIKLNYAVLPAGAHKYTKIVSGGFVGSRQEAKAIKGVFFELSGPDAKKYQLSGQAVFLGQAPLTIKSGVELSAQTGKEPLVALHVSVVAKGSVSKTGSASKTAASASSWENPAITSIKRQASTTNQSLRQKQMSSVAKNSRPDNKKPVSKNNLVKKVAVKKTIAKKVVAKK
jgi:hypothetical protein